MLAFSVVSEQKQTTNANQEFSVMSNTLHEMCLLDLKNIQAVMGREGDGGMLCEEVRVPTQMLSPSLRGLVARIPNPPSQYGVRCEASLGPMRSVWIEALKRL